MDKNRWERRYNRLYNHDSIPLEQCVKNYVQSICGDNIVLDHGCGSGRLSKILLKCNSFIYYNDISDIALDNLENFFSSTKYEKCKKIQGDIAEYKGENVDYIISHRVLHSCSNYMDVLNKFYEILNKTVFISTRSNECNDCITRRPGKEHLKCFSEIELKNIMEDIGFKILESGRFIELSARLKKENKYIYFIAQK